MYQFLRSKLLLSGLILVNQSIQSLMFLFSTPIKVCLLCVSLATSNLLKDRANSYTDHANLELPLNLTDSISIVNETATVNETTSPADAFYGDDDVAWPDTAASPSIALPPLNASLARPELGAPRLHCNGKAYGKNLKISSCLRALATMPEGKKALTFGERGHGYWDGVLPYRVLSPDGLCAVDISHTANIFSDKISPSELKQGVELVMEICLKGKPNEGGVVSNIGKNGDLAVRVMSNKPSVRCGSPLSSPPLEDCKRVFDSMRANGHKEIFGQKSDPDPKITVKLPATLTGNRRRCQLVVDTVVPGEGQDTYDWYKIWAAATSIEYMCLYSGRNGVALELGQSAE